MRRMRWALIAVVALALGGQGCDSSDGGTDAGVDVHQGNDVPVDPGTPEDPGVPADPGTPDPGTPDPGVQPDPGTPDPGVQPDPGTPSCPATHFGGTACFEIAACEMGCPGDEDFQTACVALGDQDGQTAFDALRTCLDGADCPTFFAGEEPAACAQAECADEMTACMPEGTKNCREIWTCRKACDAEDPGCPARCVATGTAADRDTWILYQRCIFQGECAGTDVMANGWPTQNCENFIQNNSCPIQAQACFPPL